MSKTRKLQDNKYRIIKISKEALFEFIYESIIDNQKNFFDVTDETKITSHFDIDYATGEFIALIHNSSQNIKKALELSEDINLKKLLHKMNDTTTTLFAPNRYVELSLDEILTIQNDKAK